jgi:carboxylesterase
MEYLKKLKMKKLTLAAMALCLFASCKKDPTVPAADLGGGVIMDPSLTDPAAYRISVSQPTPTPEQAQIPVIICSHGYSASTFEWDEFRTWANQQPSHNYYIDQVLLAGHGTTYDAFKASTWHDWESTIIDEYNLLVKEGYKNINIAGSSTSGTLVLDMIQSGIFNNAITKVHLFIIDPIIVPADKFLSVVGIVGPTLGYVTADNAPGEEVYYYHYRPQETLQQLENCIVTERHELEDGVTLPKNVYLKMYKAIRDGSSDPVSAVLIYNGIKTADGGKIDIQMVNSSIHVFTRLNLVPNVTELDRQNQVNAFIDITTKIFQ